MNEEDCIWMNETIGQDTQDTWTVNCDAEERRISAKKKTAVHSRTNLGSENNSKNPPIYPPP